MKILFTYFILEYKKSIKVLGKSMISIMLMLILLVSGVAAVSYITLQSQVFQKINVAIVIPDEEKELRVITQFASAMDSVRSICEFRYMDSGEAWQEMQSGEVQAIIEFPANFYEDVYVGNNTPANIYFPEQSPLNVIVFRELLTTAVSYLQTSEAGVYASLSVAGSDQTQMAYKEIGDYVASLYYKEIIRRGAIFENEVLSPIGTVNYDQYYFSALVLLVLLMSGLNCGGLYKKNNKSVDQKLKIYGLGRWKVSFVKILVMTLTMWLVGIVLYIAGCGMTSILNYNFMHLDGRVILGLFLLCASIASYFHAIYAVTDNSLQGSVMLLIVNIIMIVCSGLLIPTAYFPDAVKSIGNFLPLNLWNRYHINLIFGEIRIKEIIQVFGLMITGTGIGAVSLWKDA